MTWGQMFGILPSSKAPSETEWGEGGNATMNV